MPRPLTPCAAPGCRELVPAGRCPAHTTQRERDRGSAWQRGYDADWRRLRAHVLAGSPLCVQCKQAGHVVPAVEVHHQQTIAERPDLRLVEGNLIPLCKQCHSRITAGGVGQISMALKTKTASHRVTKNREM